MSIIQEVNFEEVKQKYTDHVFIIGMVKPRRPGALLFCRKLEIQHYNPKDQIQNDKYQFILYHMVKDIINYIIIIPKDDLELAVKTAQECSLRLVMGEPMLMGDKDFKPINFPDGFVYTLENDVDSKVYQNQNLKEIYEKEDELISQEEEKLK